MLMTSQWEISIVAKVDARSMSCDFKSGAHVRGNWTGATENPLEAVWVPASPNT